MYAFRFSVHQNQPTFILGKIFLLTILLELAPAVQLFLGRIRDRDLVKPFLRVPAIQQLPSIFMDASCCNRCFSQLSELVKVRGSKLGPDPPDLLTHAWHWSIGRVIRPRCTKTWQYAILVSASITWLCWCYWLPHLSPRSVCMYAWCVHACVCAGVCVLMCENIHVM